MDDMKDKMKGFMNKLTSSSSSKFKGQGRVLGSSSSSSSSSSSASGGPTTTTNPNNPYTRSNQQPQFNNPNSNPPQKSTPHEKRSDFSSTQINKTPQNPKSIPPQKESVDGFDPYNSLVTSGKRNPNGYSLSNVFECPICQRSYPTEDEVSAHVESCVESDTHNVEDGEKKNELDSSVGLFISSTNSVEVVLRLFGNIVKEPDNAKFRKIRMSNPKIREAIGDVPGGVELLEFVGFELKEESGEMWAVMDVPTSDRLVLISKVIASLEPKKIEEVKKVENLVTEGADEPVLADPKQINRQMKVFFSVSESVAARIQLPDSFYQLSVDEIKREADLRKKKMADSQLLIPKSLKEKQAKAAKKRYSRTIVRVQFPDGVVLQGVFAPWEPTTTLYEFVSSALKEPSLQFELLHPVVVKRRVIPHFSEVGQKPVTLEAEDLVPSALIKFRPIETDSVVFTGLCNELLEISEPLE
ncbi:hypothetical protein ACFE04_030266 [Oxalis oulophora]